MLGGQLQIPATDAGALDALRFAARLDRERVWAIEDCRHVSARLEQVLLAAGERVIRVPAAVTGQARKSARTVGKSDPIDARAVAVAVVRDGVDSFPVAFNDEHALEIRVLCDYRDQIIGERTRMINRLRWHLVTIAPEIEAGLPQPSLKHPRSSQQPQASCDAPAETRKYRTTLDTGAAKGIARRKSLTR